MLSEDDDVDVVVQGTTADTRMKLLGVAIISMALGGFLATFLAPYVGVQNENLAVIRRLAQITIGVGISLQSLHLILKDGTETRRM